MGEDWDFWKVEGALYSLGRPLEQRLQRRSLTPSSPVRPTPQASPYHDVTKQVDFGLSVRRALDDEELQDVQDHYILGVKRHGYKRRAPIIKKLVTRLNEGGEI